MDNVSLFFLIFNLNGRFPVLDNLMVFGATSLFYLTAFLVLFLGLKGSTKDKKACLLILLGLPIAILLIKFIHLFFYESRPFVTFNLSPIVAAEADASFPSRHAVVSSVLAFAFAYFKSKWALLLIPIAACIGFSRIYVGVHYPLDIVGGFAVGAISLIFALRIKEYLRIYLLR
ncbi:hypothetical protein A2867_00425 [Candidatus Daviesbacteria bacterium RIFCSPHIGHO2_01_FULL_40_11]|uniref:Phosphatidic acid phosphatase type 2/haloperoxidase domain-containing protein n=1 Tax=Candidatus Daviesbacteria bacterium RIFCSPHIGHO2_01_FULL_40_11 TaxID=1797762 RepID=A0A1F5JFC3_9BACT|nr:MAG: hypothetical protein A2867_00425 [Candidatus Daviesbacteria bacterium RIFCSPHIGHO2_01_FULL_40_11]OGE62657.1 MAG: hypothetical protein A2964_02715 [Candidatus Daviesbacteria bacterium RIFCSPLOWO2_01_FULL_40_27]